MGYTTGRKPWRSEPMTPEVEETRASNVKLFYFGLVIFVVFGILTIQLARLQLVNGDTFRQRAETNRLRQEPVIPTRGLIYDRNGVPLVENKAGFAAAVVAADVPLERQTEISIALQEIVGVPAGDVEEQLDVRRASNDPFTPAIVKDDLPEAKAFALRERLSQLPGVRVIVEPRRFYPEGRLLSHVLGFVGRIDEDEYAERADNGYEMNDYIGKSGVEFTYEAALRGTPGQRDVEADASGRALRVIDEDRAQPGGNVVLSIDVELQRKATEIIQGAMGVSRNAAAVVIDVRTGELLSLVSMPQYDNNIFTTDVDEASWAKIRDDPGKPLVNHAIAEMYPPGSTFKMITGLAALQEGVASAGTTIFSPGVIYVQNEYDPNIRYPFKDWAPLGSLNFYRGVAMSSDVYFYYLAGGSPDGYQFQGLGATRLADWTRRFGLGAVTGIDIPGESEGLVPDPKWKENNVGGTWTLGDTYHFGIGQGYVAATPIQMALVTAAIANGGNLLQPHVLKEVRSSTGQILPMNRQNIRRNLNIDARNLNVMREGMRQVVDSGTAQTAKSRFTQVAGKTGTAEFGPQRGDGSYQEHGWFTGYAPFNDPQIAVVVFLEQGNGAGTAAPAAAKIFDAYFGARTLAQGTTP